MKRLLPNKLYTLSFCPTLLLLISLLFSQTSFPLQQQMIRADAFYKASKGTAAREIYEQLLNGTLSNEQKALLNYNLGVILLSEQNMEEALSCFNQSLMLSNSPSLNSSSLIGIAWAHYNTVKTSLEKPNKKSNFAATINNQKNLFLLNSAMEELALAKKINCAAIGSTMLVPCIMPDSLKELELNIEREIAKLKTQAEIQKHNPQNLLKALSLLTYELTQNRQLVDTLIDISQTDAKLIDQYKKLTTNYLENLNGIWENLDTQNFTEKQKELWLNVKHFYMDTIVQVEGNEFSGAKQSLFNALLMLEKLMKDLWADTLLLSGEQLLLEINSILAVTPLQKKSVISMQQHLSAFYVEITEHSKNKPLDPKTVNALNILPTHLNLAVTALSKQHNLEARIWVEDSQRILQSFIESLTTPPADIPSHIILVNVIQQQMILAHWLERWINTPQQDPLPSKLLEVFINVQNEIIYKAKTFLVSVKNEQEKSFQAGFCQNKPWDTVLPFYEDGLSSALHAHKYLATANVILTGVLGYQQKAVDSWLKALNALEAHTDKNSNEQKDSTKNIEEKQTQSTYMQNPVSLLLEMENADQSMPQKAKSATKPGLKPW